VRGVENRRADYDAPVTIPDFLRRPLKGMATGLGRFVLRVVKLAVLTALTGFVLLVLDALLLRGVRREEGADMSIVEASLDNS